MTDSSVIMPVVLSALRLTSSHNIPLKPILGKNQNISARPILCGCAAFSVMRFTTNYIVHSNSDVGTSEFSGLAGQELPRSLTSAYTIEMIILLGYGSLEMRVISIKTYIA